MIPFDHVVDAYSAESPARLILVGPPGTGKTRAALEHFILPALRVCDPAKVLACSFSNAAADELRTRLSNEISISADRLRETCSTIHSEALRRYKRFGATEPRLYDPITGTAKSLKRDTAPDADAGTASKLREAAASCWDFIRALCVDKRPNYDGWCNAPRFTQRGRYGADEIAGMIDRFESEKQTLDAIDFTDMLARALQYEGRELDLLLVDEAQDMTPLQWALIDHWSLRAARVVVIGDGDQAIHEWMGASYKQFISRVRSPDWQARVLSQSYRVPLAAHAAARYIIGRVNDREDAEYAPAPREGSADWHGWPQVLAEAQAVAQEYADAPETITDAGETHEGRTRSMFLLCRTNMQVALCRKELNHAGLPYASEDPGEPVSFAPSSAMRARAIIDLCDGKRVPLAQAKAALDKLPAKEFFDGVKSHRLAALDEMTEAVTLSDLPWLRLSAPQAGLDALKLPGDASYWLALARKYGSWIITSPPPIRVLTWHRSKGREADVVAVDARRGGAALFGAEAVDDAELRTMYVATTRTRDKLMIYGFDGARCYDELRACVAKDASVPF